MKVVTSRDNALVKRLHAMAASTSQQRRAEFVLAEGIHLASAFLDAGGVPLEILERGVFLAPRVKHGS